ncbi:IclR helix-turn-helix domain-containing protein [Desulfofundulus australicus DSM 11792]|uniref:IclR helix-turn-helix domain-containing protein n=1 Tax=Desulfofundulus australicus DSM 11792 TaxID=1121425 RepID=A0A1M5D1D6_9FIRM|nr:AAA family ATPase [Desulfofundulus australicus]SHF60816.1 IclR helix-turn-helix domain-containing protein [Desulfofundulus australicus DSM 11792]
MTLTDIITCLKDPKPDGKGGYLAFCPCHNDGAKQGRRSLHISVSEKDGRVLLHCFAGCRYEDIVSALGLPKKTRREREEPEAIYPYVDEQGKLLFEVLRYPGKRFAQRRPDRAGGWVYNLQGVRRVLYKLPEVLAAVREGRTVFLVEGEKDCDNLTRLGLTATTAPGGAGKWRPEYSEFLRGADVVLLPDNDLPGRKHAEQVAHSLYGVAKRIRVVELPGLPPKGDVSDWLAAGHTREELITLVERVQEWRPTPRQATAPSAKLPKGFSAVELVNADFPEPSWVIPGLLPEGLALLVGRPKIGKSWLALNIAVAAASGGVALGKIKVEKASVVYLALEDQPRRLKKRLASVLQGGAAPDGLFFYTEFPRLDQGGLLALEELITRRGAKLLIVDTLAKMRPPGRRNGNVYQEDYAVMGALKSLADRYNAVVLLIHHQNKQGYVDVLDSISGSTGIGGAADTTWILKRSRGKVDAELFVTGRDFEEQELALEFDKRTTTWHIVGGAEEYRLSQERQQVIELLRAAGEPMGAKDIAQALGKSSSTVRWLLATMANEGQLTKVERGLYFITNNANKPTLPTSPTNQQSNVGGGLYTPPTSETLEPQGFEGKCWDVCDVGGNGDKRNITEDDIWEGDLNDLPF